MRIPSDFNVIDSNVYQFGAIKDTYLWPNKLLGIDSSFHEKLSGRSVKIAILDTGLETSHTDLPNHVLSEDFTGEGIYDGNGHGTHVRGIINMRLDERGYTGTSPNSNLLIGKVLESGGVGVGYWLARGIHWAIENGAEIINCSLGMSKPDRDVKKAIAHAEEKGVVIVAASGNEGGKVSFPANVPYVISVGAVDHNKNIATFSNRGEEVDVVAPGVNILSTWIGKNSQYKLASGTSMASPFVASIIALFIEHTRASGYNPSVSDIKEWLFSNAEDLGIKGEDNHYGNGMVNVLPLIEKKKFWCFG